MACDLLCWLRLLCLSGPHDFRHIVVSLLLELGTPPHIVQAIARHAAST